jgi:hypothetical protein
MIAERMNLMRWVPRVLNLMLAFFLSLVGHDLALEAGRNPEELPLVTLFTPSLLMVVVLTLAWSRPRMAAVMLLSLSIVWTVSFSQHKELAAAVGVPLAVNALLYWLGSTYLTPAE